jgi:hypothetical protein
MLKKIQSMILTCCWTDPSHCKLSKYRLERHLTVSQNLDWQEQSVHLRKQALLNIFGYNRKPIGMPVQCVDLCYHAPLLVIRYQ